MIKRQFTVLILLTFSTILNFGAEHGSDQAHFKPGVDEARIKNNYKGQLSVLSAARNNLPQLLEDAFRISSCENLLRARTENGFTPLMYAAREGNLAILIALLNKGFKAIIQKKDENGFTALEIAQQKLNTLSSDDPKWESYRRIIEELSK